MAVTYGKDIPPSLVYGTYTTDTNTESFQYTPTNSEYITYQVDTNAASSTHQNSNIQSVFNNIDLLYDPQKLKQFDPEYDTDTQEDDPRSILKRLARGCEKGNSCVVCNNKRIRKEYNKKLKRDMFPYWSSNITTQLTYTFNYTSNVTSTDVETAVNTINWGVYEQ